MANHSNRTPNADIKVNAVGSTPTENGGPKPLIPNGTPSSTEAASNGRVKRKQWVLHDGPHGSLQRLRLRMAEEGCGHSQVALAKQFLSENSGESDQIAIHWLIKAVDQGHIEGLELLKSCFDQGRGITESNLCKIRNFLDMSQHERAARLGAKTLFASMAHGSEFVTTKQLEQWLEESFANQKLSEEAKAALANKSESAADSSSLVLGGELLSEQHLMSAASDYASGHFPPLLRLLNLGSKQKLSYLCHWLTQCCVLNLFTQPLSLSLMFSLVIIFTALNNSLDVLLNINFSSLLVLLSWVLALGAAAVFTAQSCRSIRDWNVFHGWSMLLSQYAEQRLEPAVPEQLYIQRTIPPHFGRLLLAAVPCVSLQPALQLVRSSLPQPGLWLPFGELGVLASLLCSACLDCRFGLGMDDLFCMIGWILWRTQISSWSSFSSDDNEAGVDEDPSPHQLFHPTLHVRFHVMAIPFLGFLILVPLYIHRLRQFSHMSHLLAWSLPHFASLVWLFLAIDWLQLSTYDGVLRGLILSGATVLFCSNCNWLTKANLLLCCITSYSYGSAFGLTPWIALGVAIGLIAAVRMSAQFLTLTSQRYNSLLIRRPLLYLWTIIKTSLMVACLAILALRLMEYLESHTLSENAVAVTSTTPPPMSGGSLVDEDAMLDPVSDSISWERYRNYCAPSPSGAVSSIASTQLACSALSGINVQWEGVVKQISIDSRNNWVESLLAWLPSKWSEWLSCRIGEKWPDCHEQNPPQSFESKRCHLLWRINQHRGRHCHVDRYSKFTFRLEVEPKLPNKTLLSSFFDSKVTVDLLAGPRFQSIGLRLALGHVVRFQGTLSSPSVGGLKTELELTALECLSCQPDNEFPAHQPQDPFQQQPLAVWPDVATFASSALQGAADFVLPHFIRLNVTRLWS